MAAGQATAQASQTALVERLGALPVEHGRHLCGLSMRDVFEQVREAALVAAKQKQMDSSSRSQNLLQAYCRARLALEELEATASNYGVLPRTVLAQNLSMPGDEETSAAARASGETALEALAATSSFSTCPAPLRVRLGPRRMDAFARSRCPPKRSLLLIHTTRRHL